MKKKQKMEVFEIGDVIKVVNNHPENRKYEGLEGTIIERWQDSGNYKYHIKFKNGEESRGWTNDNDMKLNLRKINMKIGTMMNKLLDKDTQLLVKAGFINGDLELTDAGQNALITILFTDRKAELVELAKEIIEEEEKENK